MNVLGKMFATHCINVDREPAIEKIYENTKGRMADFVVEAVGLQMDTIN
ncbi:MAG: hypothetical protein SWO11_04760 [Thermodesulfobacteriota bacterium]|nr:hypothetical protein [Thermodesulfobacteriota bacterium]